MSAAELRRRGVRVASALVAAGLVAGLLAIFLGQHYGWFAPARQQRVLLVYCFSTLDDAMTDGLFPAFRDHWRRERGETVELVATFAGSGELTDRILERYPAEIAIVTSEIDAIRLPVGWLSWRKLPHRGVLARTPLVIVAREGNPHGIESFGDLGREGLEILHGDPATSGVAELAIIGAYESERRRSADSGQAFRRLLGLWRNVTLRLPSGREVRSRFEAGSGDAFVTYEQDALAHPSRARIAGALVVPRPTILAEPVVVRIDRNVDERNADLVDAFLRFLWSPAAQRILVEYGFRSVEPDLDASRDDLATVEAFTLDEVGGVGARREILEAVWRDRVAPALQP